MGVAYGLTLALLAVQATWFVGLHDYQWQRMPQWFSQRIGAAVPGVVLMAVVAQLLLRWHRPLTGRDAMAALASAAAVAIVSFEAPGISIALMIVLLGFANGNRVLAGLGVTALLGYVSAYYYLLETTLLVKSMTLGATGAVLLLAREALARWFLTEAEVETSGA